jgi:hypothetical protein
MAIEQSELAGLFTQQYNITDGSDEEYPADPTDAPVGTRHSAGGSSSAPRQPQLVDPSLTMILERMQAKQ